MPSRNDPISDRAAHTIARLRRGRGYSGKELAERCAAYGNELEPPIESTINLSAISKIENGDRTVSLTELVLFAGALAVTPDTLMGIAPEVPITPLEDRVTTLEQTVARILEQPR